MKALGNWRTSAIGVALAVLTYWHQVGGKLPATADEWFGFGVATLLAALGVLAKDGATGSPPE